MEQIKIYFKIKHTEITLSIFPFFWRIIPVYRKYDGITKTYKFSWLIFGLNISETL